MSTEPIIISSHAQPTPHSLLKSSKGKLTDIKHSQHFTLDEVREVSTFHTGPLLAVRNSQKQLVSAALNFLEWYDKNGDEMLDHIMTWDETWIFVYCT